MKIIETKVPSVALTLLPWFVPINQSREDIYLELAHRLETTPEDTLVIICMEGEMVKGMMIAYCRYKDVFLWQVRRAADLSRTFVDKAFGIIKEWTRRKGFNHIAAITNRSRALQRKWGFQPSANNEMILEI